MKQRYRHIRGNIQKKGLVRIISGRPKRFEIINLEEGLQKFLDFKEIEYQDELKKLDTISKQILSLLSDPDYQSHLIIKPDELLEAYSSLEGMQLKTIEIIKKAKKEICIFTNVFTGLIQLKNQLLMLWIGYDATAKQARMAKQRLIHLSKRYTIIRLWKQLAGIGVIRAVTLFAYLDTPWRFKRKNKLWKYCGIGLQRTTSGTDKKGKPKPARLQLPWAANRILKNAILGAALTAINQRQNFFKTDYERMVRNGIMPSNARHTVARTLLTVMWGMWKRICRDGLDEVSLPKLNEKSIYVY